MQLAQIPLQHLKSQAVSGLARDVGDEDQDDDILGPGVSRTQQCYLPSDKSGLQNLPPSLNGISLDCYKVVIFSAAGNDINVVP